MTSNTKFESPAAQRKTPPPMLPGGARAASPREEPRKSSKRRQSAGRPHSDDPNDYLGTMLGAYRCDELLGRGGMGYVFRAEHVKLGRAVALKLLRADYARRRDAVARFFQEARTVNRVRHRNIVDVTDWVELDDGTTFIIMELLSGISLGKWARSGVDMPRALAVLVQICDGLGAAHHVGVVHRDLKPDNVIVIPTDDGGELVKLLDFGVAKLLNHDDEDIGVQTQAGTVIGTPAYMSPEQAGGMAVDHRTDIYSLGAIMYEMFCGQPMFRGRSFGEYVRKHLTELPVRPRATAGGRDLDERLEALILKCIDKEPASRFDDMHVLRDHLLTLFGGLDTGLGVPGPRHTPEPRPPAGMRTAAMPLYLQTPNSPLPPAPVVYPQPTPPPVDLSRPDAWPLPHDALVDSSVSMSSGRQDNSFQPPAIEVPSFDAPSVDSVDSPSIESAVRVNDVSLLNGPIPRHVARLPSSLVVPAVTVGGGFSTAHASRGTPWYAWTLGAMIMVGLGGGATWYFTQYRGTTHTASSAPAKAPVAAPVDPTPAPPPQPELVAVRFDSTPAARVVDAKDAELCRTPCAFGIDLHDGGATDKRTFVVRADGYEDKQVVVFVGTANTDREFRVTLDRVASPSAGSAAVHHDDTTASKPTPQVTAPVQPAKPHAGTARTTPRPAKPPVDSTKQDSKPAQPKPPRIPDATDTLDPFQGKP